MLSLLLLLNQDVKYVYFINFISLPTIPINIYHPEGEYLKGLVLYVED